MHLDRHRAPPGGTGRRQVVVSRRHVRTYRCVIGNPLETTVALSHWIFEGTLDRFPGIKICGAYGGGYGFTTSAEKARASPLPDSLKPPPLHSAVAVLR